MSDYEDIDTEMDNLDDMMEDHDVFEDNDEVRNFFNDCAFLWPRPGSVLN